MMASLLTFQLQRIEAMRHAGQNLYRRPIFGRDVFGRPAHVRSLIKTQLSFDLKLHDLLHSYGQIMAERQASFYKPAPRKLYKLEDAMERLRVMLGLAREWTILGQFMPPDLFDDVVVKRSAIASTFGACLELAKQGAMDLNQAKPFAPIYIRQIIYQGDANHDNQ
jgi:segregation and condensation protein A